MKKQAEISCSDCFFRRSDLCALAGNIPCPTFRHAKALEPPKQPRLVARQPLAAARAA
jgi:hypothetical protein